MHPFRFALQGDGRPRDADGPPPPVTETARRAEAAGFDVLSCWDHLGSPWSAIAPLAMALGATDRLRVATAVLNNDFRHPIEVAREFQCLHDLSGGRVEVGLGAGHSAPEYASIGLPFDPPAVRKERMMSSLAVLHSLFHTGAADHHDEHYDLTGATVARREDLPPVRLLAGVNGRRWLARAAEWADVLGPTMLGRTHADGARHDVRFEPRRLDELMAGLRTDLGDRMDELEWNALVQMVIVTDDRERAAAELAEGIPTLDAADALETPFLAIGTHDEIADHWRMVRERWGFSYFTVRSLDEVVPIIETLRADP